MTRLFCRAALVAAILVLGGISRPATADFDVCSQYRSMVYVAYGYYDGADWVSSGWWTVNPGACTTMIEGDLSNQYYYLYAQADDGAEWGGESPFCVEWSNAFTIWGNVDCTVGFFEVDTGNARSWTHTLTP